MAALTAQDPGAKRVKALCTPARATQKVAAADSDRRPSREGIGTAVGTGTPAGDPDATAEGIRDGHATVLLDERRAARPASTPRCRVSAFCPGEFESGSHGAVAAGATKGKWRRLS